MVNRDRWLTAALVLACSAALAAPRADGPSRGELKLLNKVAGEWVKLGRWCVGQKLKAEAQGCLKRAQEAYGKARGVDKLAAKVGACAEGADAKDRERYAKKRASTGKKVARLYEKLYAAGAKLRGKKHAAARKRFDEYLWRALDASPTDGRWKQVLAAVEGAKDPQRAGALADRALKLKPPAEAAQKLERILDLKAVDQLVLRGAKTHPMKYYLSLPKAWRPGAKRTWPVLVCNEGSGSNFQGMGRAYTRDRKDLPCIVVSPCTFANTNAIEGKKRDQYRKWYTDAEIDKALVDRRAFDEQGLLAVLEDLKRYDAERRIYITGFSGGGNLTYMMIFKHPDRVQAAAPACANFSRPDYGNLTDRPAAARDFPIHIITGAKDPHRTWTFGKKEKGIPGIEPQTDWAVKALKQVKHTKLKRTLVPGMGHSPARKQVLEFFGPYLRGEKQRSDPFP